MNFNSFITELLVEERMKDAMYQAEQARLIRAVEGSGRLWRWQISIVLLLKRLLALFIQPQRQRLTENTPLKIKG